MSGDVDRRLRRGEAERAVRCCPRLEIPHARVLHLLPRGIGSGYDFPKSPWVQTALWGGGAGAGKEGVIGETGPRLRLKLPTAIATSR